MKASAFWVLIVPSCPITSCRSHNTFPQTDKNQAIDHHVECFVYIMLADRKSRSSPKQCQVLFTQPQNVPLSEIGVGIGTKADEAKPRTFAHNRIKAKSRSSRSRRVCKKGPNIRRPLYWPLAARSSQVSSLPLSTSATALGEELKDIRSKPSSWPLFEAFFVVLSRASSTL